MVYIKRKDLPKFLVFYHPLTLSGSPDISSKSGSTYNSVQKYGNGLFIIPTGFWMYPLARGQCESSTISDKEQKRGSKIILHSEKMDGPLRCSRCSPESRGSRLSVSWFLGHTASILSWKGCQRPSARRLQPFFAIFVFFVLFTGKNRTLDYHDVGGDSWTSSQVFIHFSST